MSAIPQNSVKPNSSNMGSLPDALVNKVSEYLIDEKNLSRNYNDRKTLIYMFAVCKSWSQSKELIGKMNKLEKYIESCYPKALIQILKDAGFPIRKIPEIHLGNRRGNTGYIDFIEPKEIRHPVTRFTDTTGRPGFIFKFEAGAKLANQYRLSILPNCFRAMIKNVKNFNLSEAMKINKQIFSLLYKVAFKIPQQEILTIFQRYANDQSIWVRSWSDDGFLDMYKFRYNRSLEPQNANNIPSRHPVVAGSLSDERFGDLLKNNDPDFKLVESKKNNRTILSGAVFAVSAFACLAAYYFTSRRGSI